MILIFDKKPQKRLCEYCFMMQISSYVTKTLEYVDFYEDRQKEPEDYLKGINKRWLIESVVHMISVDRFDSFSMKAERGLLSMFQDYTKRVEVKQLFRRLFLLEKQYQGVWLTLINHQALFRLLRTVLLMPNERYGKGESYEAYESLLKATLSENSREMSRERIILSKISNDDPNIRDAMIIMQQDILNLDQFGENKKELEKAQQLKYLILCQYGKKHNLIGDAIKRVVNNSGFQNEYKYLLFANLPVSIYHDKNHFGEGLISVCRNDFKNDDGLKLWNAFVSYVSDKYLDVWNTDNLKSVFKEDELLDNTCFRKYPVLKLSDEEYLIISHKYYSHLFYDGFWWCVKEELKKKMSEQTAMDLLTREFSEKRLFYDITSKMSGDRRIRLYNSNCFKEQQAAPDLALMTRRRLFLFEYKDMRVSRKVADGSDINNMMDFLEDRLNKRKGASGGNKGLPQLVSNMEDFFSGKAPWGKSSGKGNIKIYPVLVVNSRLLGVRGINYIMQNKLRQRIMESEILRNHMNEIGELLVTDMDMMILVTAYSNGDFALFQRAFFGYQTHIKRPMNYYDRYDSFRNYLMNMWSEEKSVKQTRHFKKGYKALVKSIVK